MGVRAKVVASVATTIVAGALSGCLFGDDSDEDCGSHGSLTSSAIAVSCVDPGDTKCVGAQDPGRAIRVDSYGIRLPSGHWVRSEGADFDAKPPRVTLALADSAESAESAESENATTREVAAGQAFRYDGSTFRVLSLCDTGVTWLVPAG